MTQVRREPTTLQAAFCTLAAIERAGNLLPRPFWHFCIMAGIVIVLSAVLQAMGVSAVNPSTRETVTVQSLLSPDGVQTMIDDSMPSLAAFPPLALTVTVTVTVTELRITDAQRKGMRLAGITAVVVIGVTAVSMIPAASLLRDEGGSVIDSPGTGGIEGIRTMAPIMVLSFAVSQFLAYFKRTGMGEVLAISSRSP